ncbi:MAG: hypothetical protein AAFV19_03115 [Pseudomonadota bacterium]
MFQGTFKYILGVLVVCVVVVVGIQSRVPTITDLTQGDGTEATWKQGVDRRFRVEIERSFLYSIDDVRLKYTRHFWPGSEVANTASIVDLDPDDEIWEAKGNDLETAPRTHSVFYEWEVDYTSGFSSGTVTSGALEFTIGCTEEDTFIQLRAQRDDYLPIYDVYNPVDDLLLSPPGNFLSHGFASLENMGFGVSSYPAGAATLDLDLPTSLTDTSFRPQVVLYRPRQRTGDAGPAKNESYEDYKKRITDSSSHEDPPYDLLGWTFGIVYKTNEPPVFGCIPSKEWFIHEAGWHMHDGSMIAEPIAEDRIGARDDMPPVLDANLASIRPGAPDQKIHFYHGRGWVIHVWLDPNDPNADPILQIEAPVPDTHDTTLGPYVPGLSTAGLFPVPEIWD